MLHTLCASCKRPLPFDQIASWLADAPLCGAECEATYAAASPPAPSEAALTTRARRTLSRARRDNLQLQALEALAHDRMTAAGKIIGITKGARRRKASLQSEANEFNEAADSARFDLESRLTELMGPLMALRERHPALVEPAIGLVNGFPAYAGRPDTDRALAEVEATLTGQAPAPMHRALVEAGSRRAERHHDAFCVYESQRHEGGGEAIWTLEGAAPWADLAKVEDIDGSVELCGQGGVLASMGASEEERETIFSWVREERPELQDAQRSMTALEAMSIPGCLFLVVAGVGGAITGALAFFEVATLWVAGVGGLTGALGLLPVIWGVMRLVNRPIVRQLVAPDAAPEGAALAASI